MPRLAAHLELRIQNAEGVYEPADDSFLAAEMAEKYLELAPKTGIKILEIGTGTGIIGLSAGTSPKVSDILFVDINPKAISCAKQNLEHNRDRVKANCEFLESDLLANVGNRLFDLIIFNPPYLPSEKGAQSNKEVWDGGKTGIEITQTFIEQALQKLAPEGRILIVYSSLANEEGLLGYCSELDLAVEQKKCVHIFFEDICTVLLKKQ